MDVIGRLSEIRRSVYNLYSIGSLGHLLIFTCADGLLMYKAQTVLLQPHTAKLPCWQYCVVTSDLLAMDPGRISIITLLHINDYSIVTMGLVIFW